MYFHSKRRILPRHYKYDDCFDKYDDENLGWDDYTDEFKESVKARLKDIEKKVDGKDGGKKKLR